jgi:hypothetical protein
MLHGRQLLLHSFLLSSHLTSPHLTQPLPTYLTHQEGQQSLCWRRCRCFSLTPGGDRGEQLFLVGVAAASLFFALVFILVVAVVKDSLLFVPLLLVPIIIVVVVIVVLLKHVSMECSSYEHR